MANGVGEEKPKEEAAVDSAEDGEGVGSIGAPEDSVVTPSDNVQASGNTQSTSPDSSAGGVSPQESAPGGTGAAAAPNTQEAYNAIIALATGQAIKKTQEIINTKLGPLKNKVDEMGERLDKFDDKQISIIETLAIFIALFTFVSVDFQVFRIYQDPKAVAGLTLILLGSMLAFVTTLDFVLNVRLKITKTRRVPGSMDPFLEMARMVGYEEEIEFKWYIASTLGTGFKVKFMPLTVIWVLMIIAGVFLFVSSPQGAEANSIPGYQIENQGSSIQIQGNSVLLPSATKQQGTSTKQ